MFCVLLRRRVVSALVGHIFFHCLEMRLHRFFYRQQPGHFPEIYLWIAYFVFNTGVSISFTRRLPADVPWKSRKKAWTYRRPRLCGSSLDFEFVTMYEINKILPKFHFLTKIEKKKDSSCVLQRFVVYCVFASRAIWKPFYRSTTQNHFFCKLGHKHINSQLPNLVQLTK